MHGLRDLIPPMIVVGDSEDLVAGRISLDWRGCEEIMVEDFSLFVVDKNGTIG